MRNVLVIGGLVVVAVAVGLWLVLAKDDGTAQATSPTVATGSAVHSAPPRGAPTVTEGTPSDRPALPQAAPGENSRDYVVGDVRVRDHRDGDNKPLDIPPNVHPAEGRQIPSMLTHEIAQKVKA